MAPFVSWPEQQFLRRWEGKATELRHMLNLRDEDRLDPFKLIDALPSAVAVSAAKLLDEEGAEVLSAGRSRWWAAAYREDQGPWMIFYSPWQASTRLRSSLMEEVAHIHLGHRPSKLEHDPITGLTKRSYSKTIEKEAYGVACAALLPFVGLVRMLANGATDAEVCARYEVSPQLMRYRASTTRARLRASALAQQASVQAVAARRGPRRP